MSHILQHILVLALPGNIKELDVLLSDECKELHTYPSNKMSCWVMNVKSCTRILATRRWPANSNTQALKKPATP